MVFDRISAPPRHPNTLAFRRGGRGGRGSLAEERWCSVGGGFVVREEEVGPAHGGGRRRCRTRSPTAAELLARRRRATGLHDRRDRVRQRDARCARRPRSTRIWTACSTPMMACIDRGMRAGGVLPGRAEGAAPRGAILRRASSATGFRNTRHPHEIMDHVSLFAIAVNEENAAGGRVVTAPTNGAAGVVPAVLRYYRDFCPGASAAGDARLPADRRPRSARCSR